jgi:hypothetical protein
VGIAADPLLRGSPAGCRHHRVVDFSMRKRLLLGGAAASAAVGVGVSFLVGLLGHPVLWELVGDGVVGWTCALVLSFCFMVAVLLMQGHCLLNRSWFWPGWVAGLVYVMVLAAGFGVQESPIAVRLFSLYMTSIPFQLAVLTRRLSASVSVMSFVAEHPAAGDARHGVGVLELSGRN